MWLAWEVAIGWDIRSWHSQRNCYTFFQQLGDQLLTGICALGSIERCSTTDAIIILQDSETISLHQYSLCHFVWNQLPWRTKSYLSEQWNWMHSSHWNGMLTRIGEWTLSVDTPIQWRQKCRYWSSGLCRHEPRQRTSGKQQCTLYPAGDMRNPPL